MQSCCSFNDYPLRFRAGCVRVLLLVCGAGSVPAGACLARREVFFAALITPAVAVLGGTFHLA